jgi:(E)-4-hydroxy-3-methylbut-2-enyl-diphosphate synthase
LKVSLKSSSVLTTVAACRQFAEKSDVPLHLGVTEAGVPSRGVIKSAVGIGSLLLDGIGETIRVSLTCEPEAEVRAARGILESCGLLEDGPEIVSCPTCGRTKINLVPMAEAVEREVERLRAEGRVIHLKKVAVMGCEVNGPGEARDADVGIAGGNGRGILFKHGEKVMTLPEADLLEALLQEIRKASV